MEYNENLVDYTEYFIMFSVITNIYNKKTKGPTLMELFTATGKLKKFFIWQLEMFDVCRVTVVHTSNISSCQIKNFFSFPVAVNNSIKVDSLVFLLYKFVITENIMKRPICCKYILNALYTVSK